MTNFERIKAMSVEEMAKLFFELDDIPCGYTDCLDNNCFEYIKNILKVRLMNSERLP